MNSKNYDIAVQLRHEMHRHPELSNCEQNTLKLITNYIEKYTDFKAINTGTYLYVDYKVNDDKYIAFRCDIDALPMDEYIDVEYGSVNQGVCHKCGHDGHSSTMLAFMLEVSQQKPKQNILFIFQHAEETVDGAKVCVELFKKYNVDCIYGYHNMSGLAYKKIGIIYDIAHLGSYGMEIELIGKESHASEPEKGINPVFAFADIVANLSTLTKGALCSVVHLDVGQNAYGISAGKGYLRLTIRSDEDEILTAVKNNIVNYTKEQAQKYGLSANFTYSDYFPVTYNHKESVDKVIKAANNLHINVINLEKPHRASEDFGVYTQAIKGAMFYIGNGEDYPSIHTDEYDFRDENIAIGADMYMELLKSI